jgi:RecA/RadA recombinase
METSSNDVTGKKILEHLKSIEARISKVESYLNISSEPADVEPEEAEEISKKKVESEEELEFRIGQFWFAKLGISVFLIGWIIGNTLPFENLNQIIPVAVGFLTGLIGIASSIFLKNRFPHIAGYILGSGFVIIYLAAVRTHFFSSNPIILDFIPVIVIVYFISFVLIFTGIKWGSPYISALGFSAAFLSALIGNNSYLIFLTITLIAILSSNFKIKFNWNGLFNFTVGSAYLVHLIWFINNPLIGNSLELKIDDPINLIFILLYQVIFTFAYFADKKYDEYLPTAISILANTSMGYGLL